jgi:hypothetical protein
MTRLILLLALLIGCAAPEPAEIPPHPAAGDAGAGALSWLPRSASSSASSAFWEHWGDGQAEMAGYRSTVMRYGEPREAETVLIFVTEPVNRRTWIKDDDAGGSDRVNVLKLNTSIQFLTGVYPYAIMSSVFSPVDDWGGERFTPGKIVFSGQEWCGIYTHLLWPGAGRFTSTRLSYFASEGEATEVIDAPAPLLYEDALPIQLRELDGPFARGGNWEGHVVPSAIHQRFLHLPVRPVPARITRSDAGPVTRFVLAYEEGLRGRPFTRTFEIEKEMPRRLMAWSTSAGDHAELMHSTRMAYWELNGTADVERRRELGLGTD